MVKNIFICVCFVAVFLSSQSYAEQLNDQLLHVKSEFDVNGEIQEAEVYTGGVLNFQGEVIGDIVVN